MQCNGQRLPTQGHVRHGATPQLCRTLSSRRVRRPRRERGAKVELTQRCEGDVDLAKRRRARIHAREPRAPAAAHRTVTHGTDRLLHKRQRASVRQSVRAPARERTTLARNLPSRSVAPQRRVTRSEHRPRAKRKADGAALRRQVRRRLLPKPSRPLRRRPLLRPRAQRRPKVLVLQASHRQRRCLQRLLTSGDAGQP